MDPSVAYDSVSAEPILNVYQTLVAYNGNNTSSFLPELAQCVPGPGCASMFGGNTLIVNNTTTGAPQYWTLPIDPAAHFYDPSTRVYWMAYPSDVAFTFARTCGFANLPGFAAQPGWIQCQALLPSGNNSWDSGIHYLFNNTPQRILGSILINDSAYCPPIALQLNGCVTFNASGGGSAWPFLLQLLADPLGGSIEPCGWFTFQGASVPGFAGTDVPNGDGPCLLPGGAKSTSDVSFLNWSRNTPSTAWDAFERLALNTPGIQPGVRWKMVGSGPYYLSGQPFQQSVGYMLRPNPAYLAPSGCQGQPNCEPGPSSYIPTISVNYTATDTIGLRGYANGTTDFATILTPEGPQMLVLLNESRIGRLNVPTGSIFALAFALTFSPTAAKTLDPNPINVPGDFFSYVGLREFLAHAFPYNTVENSIFTADGIQYGINYGGAIPHYTGDYYPTNISWPTGDPVSNVSTVGSAGWWWAQATSSSSPYYDPELANCSSSSPCQVPIVGQQAETQVDQMIQDYLPYISQITGGRISPNTFDVSDCFSCCTNPFACSLPGQSAVPMAGLGWAPDYPDPTDYVMPLYYPNATFTGGTALEQTLAPLTCSQGPVPASAQGLVYWAGQFGVPQACQGNAYGAMEWGMNVASGMADGSARVLMYNLIEHVANELALYVYYDQSTLITTYASWIAKSSLDTNPMIGGLGDFLWYDVRYGPVVSSVAFTEAGLPPGTTWTVTLNGTPISSTGTTITFVESNGRYPYAVGPVGGYSTNPSSGTVTVAGVPVNVTIVFAPNSSSSSGSMVDAYVAYGLVFAGVPTALVLARRARGPPSTP